MSKIAIWALIFSMTAGANLIADSGADQLKHMLLLDKFGEGSFKDGTYNNIVVEDLPVSIYSLEQSKSIYCRYDDYEICRSVSADLHKNKVTLKFKDRLLLPSRIHVFNYAIGWDLCDREGKILADLDENYSDMMGGKLSRTAALACIQKYGRNIYQIAQANLQETQELKQLMNVIGPGTQFYQDIWGSLAGHSVNKTSSSIPKTQGQTKTLTKVFGVSTNNTRIYIDFGYPVIDVVKIKVKGLGGVAFYERSAAVPNVIYFAGVAYKYKSAVVTVTVCVLSTPVPKKKIVMSDKYGRFTPHNTSMFMDFGYPVIHIRYISAKGGLGGVTYREVYGTGLRLKGYVYNTPGYFGFRAGVAVYK